MSRFAPWILLVVGLAVGLWLGFNPHAHQQVVQDWNHIRLAFVHAEASLHLPRGVGIAAKTPTRAQPTVAAPSATAAWRQISTEFQVLVNGLQRLWLQISARI